MGVQMITIPELVAQALGTFLTSETKSRFGASQARLAEFLPYAARLTGMTVSMDGGLSIMA